jgi:hypothetical protein
MGLKIEMHLVLYFNFQFKVEPVQGWLAAGGGLAG